MLGLIGHIVQISSRRDRTEINSAMVNSVYELFRPEEMTVYRCYNGNRRAMVFACAGIGPNGPFIRNAYLQNGEFKVRDGQVEDDF